MCILTMVVVAVLVVVLFRVAGAKLHPTGSGSNLKERKMNQYYWTDLWNRARVTAI
jgi:uncharacterized membrane protein